VRKLFNSFRKKTEIYQSDSIVKEASKSLEENLAYIKQSFVETEDLKTKKIRFNDKDYTLVFLESVVDGEIIDSKILNPLFNNYGGDIEEIVPIKEIVKTSDLNKTVEYLTFGNSVLIEEHERILYILSTPKTIKRAVQEPTTEQVIRGSHEGFIEDITTNISLVRKRINNSRLKVKYFFLGKRSNNKVAIMYIENLTNPKLVQRIEKRLKAINTEYLQAPGHLEELIEDTSFSPFPQMLNTERPDSVAANLMDGRIVILTDASPAALILPVTLIAFFQTPDDYNSRWHIGTFYRLLRLISFVTSLVLPSLYIAIISFHYEVIPVDLIFTVKASLEYVPFPPLLEAIGMQVILELLREAAVRLPSPIAQTIGVVGGLVIGTAVVEANLVSNTMIIIVALTAIASFSIPTSEMGTTLRVLGYPLMLSAALFGFVGIVIVLMFILIHLSKLESLGQPYFAPFAPLRIGDLKDSFIRVPLWMMNKRPSTPEPQDLVKSKDSRKWEKEDE